jgi:hypothetical protein
MGAVFLPVTGRAENATIAVLAGGYYWSTSQTVINGQARAFDFFFSTDYVMDNSLQRYYGCAVRVVRDM